MRTLLFLVCLGVLRETAASITFVSNWDKDPSKGGFLDVQRVSDDRLALSETVKTLRGFGAASVTVKPGDDPINSSGERAEVLQLRLFNSSKTVQVGENLNSGTVYYGLTYMFPQGFNATDYADKSINGWAIVCQLHGSSSTLSPAFGLHAGLQSPNAAPGFMIQGTVGDLPAGTHGSLPQFLYTVKDPVPMVQGKWVEFIVRISYALEKTGSVLLYRRDEGQTGFKLSINHNNTATLQTEGGAPVGLHYWKQGFYRNKEPSRVDQFFLGPMVRGSSFAEVEKTAFGTSNGPVF